MKILIVRTFPDILQIDNYNVQEIGLARALALRGHCCDIVLFYGKNRDKTETYRFTEDGKEYTFQIFWLRGYSFFKNGFMPSVKRLLPQYDVIQVHEYDQIMSWQLYTRQKKPTVLYHGPYYHSYAKGYNLKCKIFDMLFLWQRRYQHVLAMTKSDLAADFLRKKGFKQVIPVGVGINLDNFGNKKEISHCNNKNDDTFRMLYVGKIEERRNVYFLVEIFRKLKEKYKNIELIIVGDGTKDYKEKFLEGIKQELDSGSITYKEKLKQEELPEIYAVSDIFLFTSSYDIFGMVLLEAMFYALPVVSTVNGGSSMLIENDVNGYVLTDFELDHWIQKIEMLIQNKDKREMLGKAAKETIINGYTWERMAEKFEKVYQEAIDYFGN